MENALEEDAITHSSPLLLDLVNAPGRPSMYWRIYVAEIPLVRGKLPVRVHVPFAHHQHQLLFCEIRIDKRKRYAMKRQVPSRVPRIFPLIRHRDNIRIVKMVPLMI